MKVGFTYDSKAEHIARGVSPEEAAEVDSEETIDGIETALRTLGHDVDRIGDVKSLVKRLAAGDRWDMVFNIAEGLRGPGREAQVPALLEAYDIPVTFGDSLCLAVCLHKGHANSIVRDHGIPSPDFVVVDCPGFDFESVGLRYPVIAKPVAEGTGKGIAANCKADDPAALREVCQALLGRHRQPVLVEEFLPGREFTVGIAGTGEKSRVLGVMEVVLLDNAEPGVYSYANKDKYEDRVEYRLVDDPEAIDAGDVALAAYRALGCRDAGRVDIRSDASGRPSFIEANPLAGLNPVHSDLPILCRLLGYGYDQLIAGIIASVRERTR